MERCSTASSGSSIYSQAAGEVSEHELVRLLHPRLVLGFLGFVRFGGNFDLPSLPFGLG